ncbi:MAG: hypothetical protein RL329_2603, partial [Bacteroidota bacterium]
MGLQLFILYARWFCDRMDIRISRIRTDWYGFFLNPYQSVRLREIRTSILSQNQPTQSIAGTKFPDYETFFTIPFRFDINIKPIEHILL